MKSDAQERRCLLAKLIIGCFAAISITPVYPADLPTFEELAVIRAKAHQDRFKIYVLKKLEVYSLVQKKRGLCFDFIGKSDGLYRSFFDSGPLMIDMANCGKEGDLVDGRIKALMIVEARERRDGLSKAQIDQVVAEINAIFKGTIYDPEITE